MPLSAKGPVLVPIVKQGRHQIIPLPKGFDFEGLEEVEISREGSRVILRPIVKDSTDSTAS